MNQPMRKHRLISRYRPMAFGRPDADIFGLCPRIEDEMAQIDRKKAVQNYQEREVIGGIFQIINPLNGTTFRLKSSADLQAEQNKLNFAKTTNTCLEPELRTQWTEFGPDVFEMRILETLKMNKDQSLSEFKEDLKLLLELWKAKVP